MCEVVKSDYGLKEEPKQWHKSFDKTMLANGFKNNGSDNCVQLKITRSLFFVFVDMFIINWDTNDIYATKCMLERKFVMKNLGVADLILGIKILRTPQRLEFSQSHRIEKVFD